ncbi:probable cytochrome P450 313b1 isoform X2 [Musca domestica]|uniref:Probable cytochrome P450 313b1 isoform X2 n=1 Tax=Musca domestica TaxID=7370 RepID=A0ABM3VRM3_MUSDO|nr:probable cytochrome P450 313b1 isoform X2 [Musca domestica]
MLTITHLLITIFALWIYILWSRRKFYKVFLQLPGPWGLPLVGLAFKMMKPESVLQYMGDLAKEYKAPFISWMGSQCFLYVNDPETMEIIFKSPCCTNKGDVYRFMANAIGDGLFTSSSPRWNKHRRLLNPAFSRKAIQAFLPVFNREASTLVKKMAVTQGQTLEIYGLLKKIVLEIACQTTMGKKMNFQDNRSTAIFEAYNGITETCVTRMLSPWLYLDVVYQFSALYKRQQQFSVALQKFVENLLADDGQTEVSHSQLGEKSREDRSFKLESQNLLDIVREHIAANQLTSQDARDEANVIVAAVDIRDYIDSPLLCLFVSCYASGVSG